MSWAFTFTAESKELAKREVSKITKENDGIPTRVGEMLTAAIDMIPDPAPDRAILVDSVGHVDNSGTYGTAGGEVKFRATLVGKVAAEVLP